MAAHAQLARPISTTTAPPGRPPAPAGTPIVPTISNEGQELITAWGLVLEATSYTTQRLSEGLERAGVSAPFFDVLVRLAREPSQRLPMTKLANEVSLTSGGFTKLADRMEQEGLLYRQHSAQDRRVIYAVLTDAGRAAAAKIFPSHVADLRRHVEGVLGVDGAAQLAALCRKLRDANTAS